MKKLDIATEGSGSRDGFIPSPGGDATAEDEVGTRAEGLGTWSANHRADEYQ